MTEMCCDNPTTIEKGFAVQKSCIINGQHTEIVFQPFVNKWFLLITQYGKMPNMFTVKFDLLHDQASRIAVEDPQFHQSVPITMTCNFGADRDEIRSAIQFLVNKTKLSSCPMEFVLSLGLKQINSTILRELVEVLNEIII